MNMFKQKFNSIIELLLTYFVRVNFNRKYTNFKKIYDDEFAIFFNDTVSKEISIYGIFEKDELNKIIKYLKKKELFVDIGAFIGNHSIYFSKYFKKVLAFEAHPKNFEILKFNCQNYKNIRLYNFGISSNNGYLYFSKNKTNNYGGRELKKKGSIKSKIIQLDKFIHKIPKETFIKIDIEGHEYNALRGMKNILLTKDPILMIELAFKNQNQRNKIINYLENIGYKNSYFFSYNKNLECKSLYNLIYNIFKLTFFNHNTQKLKILPINFLSIKNNNNYGNFIFSKRKLK